MAKRAGIAKAVQASVFPALAAYYRAAPAKSIPAFALKALGIAHPAYRSDFYTLARVTDSVAPGETLIAECGVYQGSTLLGVAHRLRVAGVKDWNVVGFDSFEGFPEPVAQDALPDGTFHPRARKGSFGDTSYDGLRARIATLALTGRVTLVKGYFESTLEAWSDRKFAIAHIDCDLYRSYLTCLEFFYDRIIPGGYIVFDEYDFSAAVYPGAKRAIDEFFSGKPETVDRFPEAKNPRYFAIKR